MLGGFLREPVDIAWLQRPHPRPQLASARIVHAQRECVGISGLGGRSDFQNALFAGRNRGRIQNTFAEDGERRICLQWRRKFRELPEEFTFARVGEAEMIFHGQHPVRFTRDLNRRPDFFDRIITAFALAIRADDAVGRLISGHVNLAGVGAFDTVVGQRPDEAAAGNFACAHHAPVIVEAGTRATVVEAVQNSVGM